MTYRNSQGFIALMSAIIISAVLLTIVATSSWGGFYKRSNGLDAELKARSVAAADACVAAALLSLAKRGDPAGSILALNELDECRIGAVSGAEQKTFEVQATSSGAVTNLRVTVDAKDFRVRSRQEIPVF